VAKTYLAFQTRVIDFDVGGLEKKALRTKRNLRQTQKTNQNKILPWQNVTVSGNKQYVTTIAKLAYVRVIAKIPAPRLKSNKVQKGQFQQLAW